MTLTLDAALVGAMLVAGLAGFVRGFAGFGSAMVMAPILTMLYGPVAAVSTGLFIEMVTNLPLLRGTRGLIDRKSFGLLSIGALLAIPLGTWLLVWVEPAVMQGVIAGVVIAAVLVLAARWRFRGAPRPVATLGIGALSGVLNGAVGIGGPPIAFYYLSSDVPAATVRASMIAYFTLIDTVACALLWWKGGLTVDTAVDAAVLLPVFLLGAWAGARMFARSRDAAYRRFTLVLLATIAVVTLVDTLRAYA